MELTSEVGQRSVSGQERDGLKGLGFVMGWEALYKFKKGEME